MERKKSGRRGSAILALLAVIAALAVAGPASAKCYGFGDDAAYDGGATIEASWA